MKIPSSRSVQWLNMVAALVQALVLYRTGNLVLFAVFIVFLWFLTRAFDVSKERWRKKFFFVMTISTLIFSLGLVAISIVRPRDADSYFGLVLAYILVGVVSAVLLIRSGRSESGGWR